MNITELTPPLLENLLDDAAPPSLREKLGRAVFRDRVLAWVHQTPFPMAWVLLDGDAPLAGFGVHLHWAGRAEGWMVLARRAGRRARVAASRGAAAKMDELQRHAAFRRIEMWVCAEEPWAASFGRALGMRCEGTARAWDPLGRDHLIYARVAPPIEGGRA